MRGKMQKAGLLLILMMSCQMASRAQKGSPVMADRERERRSFAQNVVKAINAAEADYRKKHDVYANWDTLLGIGDSLRMGRSGPQPIFPRWRTRCTRVERRSRRAGGCGCTCQTATSLRPASRGCHRPEMRIRRDDG